MCERSNPVCKAGRSRPKVASCPAAARLSTGHPAVTCRSVASPLKLEELAARSEVDSFLNEPNRFDYWVASHWWLVSTGLDFTWVISRLSSGRQVLRWSVTRRSSPLVIKWMSVLQYFFYISTLSQKQKFWISKLDSEIHDRKVSAALLRCNSEEHARNCSATLKPNTLNEFNTRNIYTFIKKQKQVNFLTFELLVGFVEFLKLWCKLASSSNP